MESRKRELLATSLGALVLGAPLTAASAQASSSRSAAVSLTAVVPPHESPAEAFAAASGVTVSRQAPNAAELTSLVGLGARRTSRVEVRLGPEGAPDSIRVSVRTSAGLYERLTDAASVVVVDVPSVSAAATHAVTFRIESDRPLAVPALALPLLYRLRVGHGDEATTWSYAVRLRGTDAR